MCPRCLPFGTVPDKPKRAFLARKRLSKTNSTVDCRTARTGCRRRIHSQENRKVPGWDGVVEAHSGTVWRIVYRILRDRHDAEDCMQKVFVSAWELSRRRDIKDIVAILKRSAVCLALDELRRRTRRTRLRGIPVAELSDVQADAAQPLRVAEVNEMLDRLRLALASLPAQEAEAFHLCCLEDMKYRDAATVMEIKVNTVASLVHRAREKLKTALAGYCGRKHGEEAWK